MRKVKTVFFVAVLASVAGCTDTVDHKGKTPLVGVGREYLYDEDLQEVLPAGLHGADSARFVERYIQNWVKDALLFQKAEGNIPDNADVDRQVEAYRRALIMHTYQEELVKQKLSSEITEDAIIRYYERNMEAFRADQPYVQGLFMKVPLATRDLQQVRSWYKQNTQAAVDKLEKFSIGNAVSYDYFYDRWIPISELSVRIPLKALDTEADYLNRNRNIEVKDTAFHYFLHVEKFLPKGEQLPLEYAKNEIKEILINLRRVEFINQMKDELYEKASEDNDIIYYNPNNE